MEHEKTALDLRPLREACGLSVSDLNRLSGVSRSTIYKLEAGGSVRRGTVLGLLEKMSAHRKCGNKIREIWNLQSQILEGDNCQTEFESPGAIIAKLEYIDFQILNACEYEGDKQEDRVNFNGSDIRKMIRIMDQIKRSLDVLKSTL